MMASKISEILGIDPESFALHVGDGLGGGGVTRARVVNLVCGQVTLIVMVAVAQSNGMSINNY